MTGLEALEIIKKEPTIYVGCFSDVYTRLPFECRRIEKDLKALEIIRTKCRVITLDLCPYYLIEINRNDMTQGEYDLLKEVLK